jgi:hypothetical protein
MGPINPTIIASGCSIRVDPPNRALGREPSGEGVLDATSPKSVLGSIARSKLGLPSLVSRAGVVIPLLSTSGFHLRALQRCL